jgi:hypothetical protein
MLVNVHRRPELVLELINNRLRRPNRPQGYSRGDVKRLRRSLQLDKHTPFIVGHTPMDREGTLWLNVDGITNHHVLFSAHPEHVAVFTRVEGVLVPLVYPVDAVSAILNGLEDDDASQVVQEIVARRPGRQARVSAGRDMCECRNARCARGGSCAVALRLRTDARDTAA